MRRIKKTSLIALLVAALITGAALVVSSRSSAPTAAPQNAKTPTAPTAAQRALAEVNAGVTRPPLQKAASHKHDLPAALLVQTKDDFRQQDHWFTEGMRNAKGKFETAKTPLVVDPSCSGRQEMQYATLEEALAQEVGFDVTQPTPIDLLVAGLTQFWRIGDTWYQMNGRWERDQPPTYRVTLFSSSNKDFADDLRVLPLPDGVTPQMDVLALGAALDRETARAVAADGARGARIVQVFYPDHSNSETLDLRISNGQPVSWMFGNGRCQRRNTGDAYCRCVVPSAPKGQSAANHNKEESFRVHD